MDEQRIRQLITEILSDSFAKRIGDTPTDALQLVNKKYVDAHKGLAGSVLANGTANFLPSGWSVIRGGNGDYTLTHNLGTTLYSFVGTTHDGEFVWVLTKSANSIRIQTQIPASALSDSDWDFLLTPQ